MNSRQRMKRRLLILATIILALVIVGGVLVIHRKRHIHAHFLELRAQGLAAVKAKKYELALNDLGTYLGQDPSDLPSLEGYTAAIVNVPQPGGKNLYQAASVIRQILYLKPDDLKYQEQLVKLLPQLNYNVECVTLAKKILAKYPNNLPALEAQAQAYGQLRKFKRAFTSADKAFRLAPDKIQDAFLALDMLYQQQLSADTLTRWADSFLVKQPANPVFQVIASGAAALANEPQQASTLALKAASNPDLPEDVILPLVRQLDSLQLYSQATAVLEHARRHGSSAPILNALCDRLYQQGHDADVLKLTSAKSAVDTDGLLLAYRARSLIRMNHPHQAAKILETLKTIKTSVAGQWYNVLNLQLNPDVSDAARMKILIAAASTFVREPYFADLLGSAYQHVGELEMALMQWQNAARLAPTWPEPILHLAAGLVRAGRLDAAKALLNHAAKLSSDDQSVVIAQLRLQAATTHINKPDDVEALLKTIRSAQQQFPGKPILLSEQIRAYMALKRSSAARSLISTALTAKPPHSLSTLMMLYTLSRQYKLGMGNTILAGAQKIYGLRPRIALAYAAQLLQAKHPEKGLAWLQSHRITTGSAAPQWDLIMAEYLSAIKNSQADAAWKQAAAAAPDNAHAQWMALSIPGLQDDRAFILDTFSRLQSIIGENGFSWKMAKAGWLVNHSKGDADLAAATKLLTQTIRISPNVLLPHLLLAQIDLKSSDKSDAINQFQVAAALAPNNAGVALQLARLYQSQGDADHARQYLEKVASSDTAMPAQQREAAGLFVADGQTSQAIGLLRRSQTAGKATAGDNLILAELYEQGGQNAAAAGLYKQLLKTPSASIIAAASRFYIRQHQPDQALKTLALLKTLKLSAGTNDLIYGDFYADTGDAKKALAAYQAAVAAAPGSQVAWYRMLSLDMRLGDAKALKETIRSAQAALPDDKTLVFIKNNLDVIKPLIGNTVLRPVAMELLAMPPVASAQSIVQTLGSAASVKPKIADFAKQIVDLANKHPHIESLQNAAIQFLITAGHPNRAAAMALNVRQMFPGSATPARLAAMAFAASHQWSQALNSAKTWRQLSLSNPMPAIVLQAVAYLNLSEPDAAARTVKPYLAAALKAPQNDPGVIAAYLQSQIALSDMVELKRVLLPLLPQSPNWRQFVDNIAGLELPSAKAALWLRRVAKVTPATALNERLQLAQSWWTLGQRVGNKAYVNQAADMLADILKDKTMTPVHRGDILSELATIQLSADQSAPAITNYKNALKLNGNMPVAQNNLAMLLIRQANPDLQSALSLAKAAVKAAPTVAAYWDTLALVQSHAGNAPAAIKAIQSAIHLDPSAQEWNVDLVRILVRAGKLKEARQALGKIDPQKINAPQTSTSTKQHYKELQQKLKRIQRLQ